MNGQMGGLSTQPHIRNDGWYLFTKYTTIIRPAPVDAWVFIDEHADSINDGFFHIRMGQTKVWYDLPASYHGGSGALAFADGHAEIKRWTDDYLKGRPVEQKDLSRSVRALPNNDLIWMQERTTAPSR